MALCKYCGGMGCTNQCMEEKQKKTMLKLTKTIEGEWIENLSKVERIGEGRGNWESHAYIDIVQTKSGKLYVVFDDSDSEYGPLAVPIEDLKKVLNKY